MIIENKNEIKNKRNYMELVPKCNELYRTKGIELDKLIWHVLEKAMDKAESHKKELIKKKKRELSRAKTEEDIKAIEEKYKKIFDEVYDTSLIGVKPDKIVVPTNPDSDILEYLSREYLCIHPKYGIKIIVEAYNEYYNIGRKCVYSGKTIPPSSRYGRTKKYYSNKYKQRAYRERKRKNNGSGITKQGNSYL